MFSISEIAYCRACSNARACLMNQYKGWMKVSMLLVILVSSNMGSWICVECSAWSRTMLSIRYWWGLKFSDMICWRQVRKEYPLFSFFNTYMFSLGSYFLQVNLDIAIFFSHLNWCSSHILLQDTFTYRYCPYRSYLQPRLNSYMTSIRKSAPVYTVK